MALNIPAVNRSTQISCFMQEQMLRKSWNNVLSKRSKGGGSNIRLDEFEGKSTYPISYSNVDSTKKT